MKNQFCCLPDGKFYTIPELEAHLKFKFLPHIAFETPEDREEVRRRGLDQLQNNGIPEAAQSFGAQFREEIQASFIPKVSVRWLNENAGYGLFAEETLEAGSYVGEYTGIVRRNDRRYTEPLNNYCYEYPVPDEIGRSFVVDATSGHLTRFINHSSTPNLKPTYAFYDGFYHLIFLAIHQIEKGSQLFYDYGAHYWYIREQPQDL